MLSPVRRPAGRRESGRARQLDFDALALDDEKSYAHEWTSETKAYALDLLRSDPDAFVSEIRSDARHLLAQKICLAPGDVDIVAFYANPRVPGYQMLSMEREMRTIMDNYDLRRDCVIVPSTTRNDMEHAISKYRPKVVCFSGHTNGQHFLLSTDPTTTTTPALAASDPKASQPHASSPTGKLWFAEFAQLTRNKNIKLIVLFACSTQELRQYFQSPDDPVVIGWASLVEDGFANTFSEALLRELRRHIASNDFATHIPAIYNAAKGALAPHGIGDPSDQLNNIEEHVRLFREKVNQVVNVSPFTRQLSAWRQTPGLFDFRQSIPDCTHCRPTHKGQPYMHAVERSAPA